MIMSYYRTFNTAINLYFSHPSLSYYNFFKIEGHPKIELLKKLNPAVMLTGRAFRGSYILMPHHIAFRELRRSGVGNMLLLLKILISRGTFYSRAVQILCARASALMRRRVRKHRIFVLTAHSFCVKMSVYILGDFFVVNNYKNKSPSGSTQIKH